MTGHGRALLDISIDAFTMAQAVGRCTDAIEQGQYLSVGVVNAAKIVAMRRDAQLKQAVNGCQMILADGQSVVWASRMLRVPLPERVAGIDLFQALLAEAEQRGSRVYFLGARPDVLKQMLHEVRRRFPKLCIAGARDGYFTAEEEPEVAADIRRCRCRHAVRRHVLAEEGTVPEPVGRDHRRTRRPWRRRLVRRAGRGHQDELLSGTRSMASNGSTARSRNHCGLAAGT